jgi:GT2 family glycosyltransferase
MRVHVLTLNWNGANMLDKLRRELGHQLAAFCMCDGKLIEGWDWPIWHIRDNGSKDDSLQTIRTWDSSSNMGPLPTAVYEAGHNRDSFARCVNFLFEQANPADDDIVFLMNNDISFQPSVIDHQYVKTPNVLKMMWALQKKTGAGVVGVRLLYENTNQLQHAGVIFSNRYNKMPFHFRPGEESDEKASKNRYFQAVTAALCLVKPASFKRVGGMDEKFNGWAFEDVDLCLRIGQDEKIAYCGEVFAYHEESASLKKNPVNKMFMNKSVRYFREKWSGKYEIDHEKYLSDPGYNEIK